MLTTWLEKNFPWEVTLDVTGPPQVIVACTLGLGTDRYHCESNHAMASLALALGRAQGLPLCLQEEVAACLPGGRSQAAYVAARTTCSHFRSGYKDTRDTLFEMYHRFLSVHGYKRILLVAHPHHAWRVAQVARKLGLEVVGVATNNIPYDPFSTQIQCRGPKRFMLYEVAIARPWYRHKGYI